MKRVLNGMITGGGFGKWLREMGEEVILPDDVKEAVTKANELGEDLEIDLTTNGGSVMDAGAMVSELNKLEGKSKVHIQGMVASAGTVLASVFDEVTMSDFSYFLIHYPRQQYYGILRPQELEELTQQLGAITQQSIDIYEAKTGLDRDVIEDYMAKESMFSASQAKDLGFVDSIVGTTVQSVSEELNINPQLVMQKSDDKYDQLYKQYSQGDLTMAKEIVEETKDETVAQTVEETKDETVEETKDEVVDETKDETVEETKDEVVDEPTIADVLQAVNKLVDAFTQSVAKPATPASAESAQATQTVEVKIAEKSAVAEQTMVVKPNFNPLGFDTTHYDI
ncbi:Clp protease-like protein [Lactococcus phage P596]|uniref:Clp protease-like protein n=1 Tax=Lactococcus phage P596 TaxID=2656515 RepID=A0A5Q2F9Z9_9CAUD|nr:Clp protease-like protein [Lactococcus phage P596]QGF21118.1 Clp protease-like protein [Lactococcus phage P596]